MDYVWVWGDQTGGNIMAPWQRCVWKPGEPFACRFLAQLIYTRRWRKQSTRRNSDLRSESLDGDSGEPHCERTWTFQESMGWEEGRREKEWQGNSGNSWVRPSAQGSWEGAAVSHEQQEAQAGHFFDQSSSAFWNGRWKWGDLERRKITQVYRLEEKKKQRDNWREYENRVSFGKLAML